MQYKKIAYCSAITALVGAGLGLVLIHMFPTPYTSRAYQKLQRVYIAVGATGGLLLGASQEALRQLQQEREQDGER